MDSISSFLCVSFMTYFSLIYNYLKAIMLIFKYISKIIYLIYAKHWFKLISQQYCEIGIIQSRGSEKIMFIT